MKNKKNRTLSSNYLFRKLKKKKKINMMFKLKLMMGKGTWNKEMLTF